MKQVSKVREKHRSDVLKSLARDRSKRKEKSATELNNDKDDSDIEAESARLDISRRIAKARSGNSSLLSILPKPKNASSFGPTVRLDQLLKNSELMDHDHKEAPMSEEESAIRLAPDGMIEVDVSKEVCDVVPSTIKDLTIERSKSETIVIPRGKEKQKNQITYLAQLGRATELEQKEKAAQNRANKTAARSKYGW